MGLMHYTMEDCVMLDRSTGPDGYGGFIAVWQEGAPFQAAITFDSSIEARTAEQQGVTSLYTVTTSRAITLQYHDYFKRIRDGKMFRATSDGDDKFTPGMTPLDMRQVTAEEITSLPLGTGE